MKITMGSDIIEMDIWPVGPGYTREEIEEMRNPVKRERQAFPTAALKDLMRAQLADPSATEEAEQETTRVWGGTPSHTTPLVRLDFIPHRKD